jgi:hypothetical protein
MDLEGKIVQINNTACFAGINSSSVLVNKLSEEVKTKVPKGYTSVYIQRFKPFTKNAGYIVIDDISNQPEWIYISKFQETETKKYVDNLISVINEIVPCELVELDKVQYIRIKQLDTYDQTLILLNFIRNLWHTPLRFNTKMFFDNLIASKVKDPLERLLIANKEACEGVSGHPGHSNAHDPKTLVIKVKTDLFSYKGNSTLLFLTKK